ncbi:MAG: hypothetical protein KGN98_05285 [Alphaproteobacteria bacterium]|nr:hypothetical protein [Alphaproteobacteria bacterium]
MNDLPALVRQELELPVQPQVRAMAEAIAAAHGAASRAVLFYGSCLREDQLDGLMLDFYLIVSDYRAAYTKPWLAWANKLIPPNVFPFTHGGLAAKYAVLSMADFAALNQPEAKTVSVWARFAQPTRLVWAADANARADAIEAVAQAAPTAFALAQPLAASPDPIDIWRAAFTRTYQCELRAERNARPDAIVDADIERYRRFGSAIPLTKPSTRLVAERRWAQLRRRGKWVSVLRLAKASLTFAGGIEYLAWKINRHAGTSIQLKPWQRRHPLLAAVVLVPKLIRQGAVR